MRGLPFGVGGAMGLTQFEGILEQFLFMCLGQQAYRVVRIAGFTAGVDKGAAAKIRRAEPGPECVEQREQAVAAAIDAFHFTAQPLHPARVAALQGGDHQFIFIGEVTVNTFSRHAGGFHQKVHAGGGDAVAIDQLLGDVEDNVAGFIARDIVHAT